MEPHEPEIDYRVEVSGWDAMESFFVEKATLELGEKGDRYVHLRHPVRSGLMVFLRLIDSRVNFPTFPIAYKVKDVTPTGSDGVSRVSLLRLPRRHGSDGEPAGSAGH
jgi:hypothetical protein